MPAFARLFHADKHAHRRRGGKRGFSFGGYIAVGGADQRGDAGFIETVFKIFLHEQICSRNRDRAQLVQSEYARPEMPVAFKHEHDSVAPPDPERFEIIRRLRGQSIYISECKPPFFMLGRDMQHGKFIGRFPRYSFHTIEGEIETLGGRKFYTGKRAVAFGRDREVAVFYRFLFRYGTFHSCGIICRRAAKRVCDNRYELAVAPLCRDHTMGFRAVIINRVPGI